MEKPFELWTGPPIPEVHDIPWLDVVTHVRVHAAVEGEHQFLHGASIVEHKGVLFASWANSPVDENSADEVVRARRSTDGGVTWSEIETIAPGFKGTAERHSHAPFLSHKGRLWSFAARWGVGPGKPFAGLRTEAFALDERTGKWESRGVVGHDCWPCAEPLQMDDGNWITAGPNKDAVLPRVMISHGDNLLKWDTVSIPVPKGIAISFAETTVIPDGKSLLAIVRPRNPRLALVSESSDFGRTWSPCRVSNYPMSDAKPYAGMLSTGQRYLVSNFPAKGMPQRDTLVIAVAEPGERTFSRLWKIRFGPSKAPLGGRAKARQWSYPYAHEHGGKLYVVYSISKEDCGLSIIPLRALKWEPLPEPPAQHGGAPQHRRPAQRRQAHAVLQGRHRRGAPLEQGHRRAGDPGSRRNGRREAVKRCVLTSVLSILSVLSAHGGEPVVFIRGGKPLAVREWGKRWTRSDGYLEGSGVGSFLYATQAPHAGDFRAHVRLSIAKLDGTAASFVLGGNHFGFDGRPDHRCFIEGKDFGKARFVGEPEQFVAAGRPFDFEAERKGETVTFRIDGKQVGQHRARGVSFRGVGLRPHRATMRVYDFWATGNLQPVRWIDMGDTSDMVLAKTVGIQGMEVALGSPPKGFRVLDGVGILAHECIRGQVVHRTAEPKIGIYETKATMTPGGDFLLMFPLGKHYGSSKGQKVNDLLACRSSDKGKTWTGPTVGFDIDYNQHGFVPLIPNGSKRIYAFGTQPIPGKWTWLKGLHENAPIGFRWSDDDGHTWSDVTLIEPVNDPGFTGMSVMRMCETDAGTWIIGSHEGDWSKKPLQTRQYLLRSEDKGKTWTVLPRPRPNGWFVKAIGRMDEGRPINLGGGRVLALFRTPEGHLWMARSEDDGKTWTDPKPTPLVHPDAPPMLFWHPDGKTLLAFHHNRHSQTRYVGLTGQMEGQKDRSELWVATSADEGRTWSEPRFLLVNALAPTLESAWRNYQCSYIDLVADGDDLHIVMPHRWRQAVHLTLKASDLKRLPTKAELAAAVKAARKPEP